MFVDILLNWTMKVNRYEISVSQISKDIFLFDVITISSAFHHLWPITGLLTRAVRRVSRLEQEVLILSGVPEFTPFFNDVDVAQSVVFCVLFCISMFVFLSFIVWSWHCLSFFELRLPITPLVSLIYGFPLSLWYLVATVLSVLLWFTASHYPFGILDLRLPISPLVS